MKQFFKELFSPQLHYKEKLFPFAFSRENVSEDDDLKEPDLGKQTTNPYINAKHEWNMMYGDIIKAKHNWQQIACLASIGNLILMAGIIAISLQSHFIPYAVNVDNMGNAQFAGLLNKEAAISPLLINAWLHRFIIESRSVISDPIAQKHQLDFVYKSSIGEAQTVLEEYYTDNSPFDVMKRETIDVKVNNVLPKSTDTWQIDWTETHRDLLGHITSIKHYEALATIIQRQPKSDEDFTVNPLGLYINHLSWAAMQ